MTFPLFHQLTFILSNCFFFKETLKPILLWEKMVRESFSEMLNLWKVSMIRFNGEFYLWAIVEFKRGETQHNCHLANEPKINYSYSSKRYNTIWLLSYFRKKISTLRKTLMSIKNICSKGDNNSLLQFRFQMKPIWNINQKTSSQVARKMKKLTINKQLSVP